VEERTGHKKLHQRLIFNIAHSAAPHMEGAPDHPHIKAVPEKEVSAWGLDKTAAAPTVVSNLVPDS
jgi:hypothetical protein